ncbi:hypothetical protein CC86DRAFT_402583 [Ophiobolus disseminans]|uniref:RING-type domain-containing protein n=1 Tax=Ophiobolus disseminans TaxID=1469910 RepID=A0A6A7ACX7_9PLEO|nr:hypothetical protein CC86DRAFT_402583 [Ophiobolus disseminans]
MAAPTPNPACARSTSTRPTTSLDDHPPICTICLEPLSTTSSSALKYDATAEPAVTIIACGHVFGRNCLARWMQDSNTCPICRVEFFMMPATIVEEPENPFFALGVCADSSVLEHFSGLVISSRRSGGGGSEGIEDRERSGQVELTSDGRRVYYA